jgi:hypothetical protein
MARQLGGLLTGSVDRGLDRPDLDNVARQRLDQRERVLGVDRLIEPRVQPLAPDQHGGLAAARLLLPRCGSRRRAGPRPLPVVQGARLLV